MQLQAIPKTELSSIAIGITDQVLYRLLESRDRNITFLKDWGLDNLNIGQAIQHGNPSSSFHKNVGIFLGFDGDKLVVQWLVSIKGTPVALEQQDKYFSRYTPEWAVNNLLACSYQTVPMTFFRTLENFRKESLAKEVEEARRLAEEEEVRKEQMAESRKVLETDGTFMVYSPQGSYPPKHTHPTYQEAVAAAHAMAKNHFPNKFLVVRVVAEIESQREIKTEAKEV